ncbi:MAG: 30S ribosomal protein S3 [bacterium]|nr:30S ribosomal protein S3 [bacterium]
MGQKIRPDSYRLGIIRDWRSRWFPKKLSYGAQLEEDALIRKLVQEKLNQAGLVDIQIERSANDAYIVFIKAARPGLIIGRGGKGVEDMSKTIESSLKKLLRKRGIDSPSINLRLNIEELKRSEIAAQYLAQSIAWDLERRLRFRRIVKKAIENTSQNKEVKGVKIKLSGRLDGSEIARKEWLFKGRMPLQTLRANIDYGQATAFCTYGAVGIKVWIYKGDVFTKKA